MLTIHRREFLIQHGIKNIPGLRCQDIEFSLRARYLAKRVVPLHEPYYIYRIRPNSIQTRAKGADYYFMKDYAIITKSVLAFYEKSSSNDDFDKRVVPCWIRQFFPRMIHIWFSWKSIKEIPREKRVKWMQFIFKEGFDSYDSMMKCGLPIYRLLAFHVRIFVKYPALRWYSDFFLLNAFLGIQMQKKIKRILRIQKNKSKPLCISIPRETGDPQA